MRLDTFKTVYFWFKHFWFCLCCQRTIFWQWPTTYNVYIFGLAIHLLYSSPDKIFMHFSFIFTVELTLSIFGDSPFRGVTWTVFMTTFNTCLSLGWTFKRLVISFTWYSTINNLEMYIAIKNTTHCLFTTRKDSLWWRICNMFVINSDDKYQFVGI